jgi:Domain of unknown function (DUF5615)
LRVRPADAEIDWEADEVHFRHAQVQGLVLITKNPKDFRALHNQDQHHPRIVGVYQDNDPTRAMCDADLVAAIANIEEAVQHGYQIAGEFHNLNAWR